MRNLITTNRNAAFIPHSYATVLNIVWRNSCDYILIDDRTSVFIGCTCPLGVNPILCFTDGIVDKSIAVITSPKGGG